MNSYKLWIENSENQEFIHQLQINTPSNLHQIFKNIDEAGGSGLYVGGCVRDHFYHKACKDHDVVVFGMNENDLLKVLSVFGQVNYQGAKYGVFVVRMNNLDFEFAVARSDTKSGLGHKEFLILRNPDLSPREEASRRDFTINSLMYDPIRCIVIDCFNGITDIQTHTLRHVSSAFAEDVSRVFRGVSQAARFNMKMDPITAHYCSSLISEYNTINSNDKWRIWLSFLTKSNNFHQGLKVLKDTRWITLYPDLEKVFDSPGYNFHVKLINKSISRCKADNCDEKSFSVIVLTFLTLYMKTFERNNFLSEINCPSSRKIEIELMCNLITIIKEYKYNNTSINKTNNNHNWIISELQIKNIVFKCSKSYHSILNLLTIISILDIGIDNKVFIQDALHFGIDLFVFKPILNGEVLMDILNLQKNHELGIACRKALLAELDGLVTKSNAKQWALSNL